MHRLLRHTKTGEYFRPGNWTANAAEAQVFASTKEAIDTAIGHGLENVELVLQFGAQPSATYDYHFTLELKSRCDAA